MVHHLSLLFINVKQRIMHQTREICSILNVKITESTLQVRTFFELRINNKKYYTETYYIRFLRGREKLLHFFVFYFFHLSFHMKRILERRKIYYFNKFELTLYI